ncbi:deoxyribodipyrimidine photo-lyase [Candidatus Saccharibacteria bacterium]|nr:deoxyribodipyrimidine photo-lyase [Candidatus Saccharibacteria bacterium]
MKVILVWYRNDLRVHDHPALSTATADADHVVPVFIFKDSLLHGPHSSANRNRFLLECLTDLKQSLQAKGADLVSRQGDAADELIALAKASGATGVYYTADYSPGAIKRDKAVQAALRKEAIEFRSFPGRLIVSNHDKLRTKAGNVHKVFTPFWKNWLQIQRRQLATNPQKLSLPTGVSVGKIPELSTVASDSVLSPYVLPGGETVGRRRLRKFLEGDIKQYKDESNFMAKDSTSRLSAYLHFGCLSALEIETMLPSTVGAQAWGRQLAWRDFYHYILLNFPANTTTEFQERFRALTWSSNEIYLQAWKDGQTGYPIVDAAMRQLRQEGWMHNRARLIVGSFLTKDLWLDWRLGETHFMNLLIDGDEANNNGNWQWIASVGVDPAPVFRRLYNPSSQQTNYDPDGAYVRKYVPELAHVLNKHIPAPWLMTADEQANSDCILGKDYPMPIVDHKQARLDTLDKFRATAPKQ